jgi:hypothetical protein
MIEKNFIFLAGLHRSGTSLLHEIIKNHPNISGFNNTGVPEDEGQHLQSVYKTAKEFGGPGRFAFNSESYMDENHLLATDKNAILLFEQWNKKLDTSKDYFIEKSPPNIVRTRFFQKLFPNSQFIIILRDPIAVSYATQKMCKNCNIDSLIEHYCVAYKRLFEDKNNLESVYILKYEDFICKPQSTINEIFNFIGLSSIPIKHEIKNSINQKYFDKWNAENFQFKNNIIQKFNKKIKNYGYDLNIRTVKK